MVRAFHFTLIILLVITKHISCDNIILKSIEEDSNISEFINYQLGISLPIKLLWQLFYSVLASILVGLSGILPLLFISTETGMYLRSQDGIKSLNRWLSFAFGSIIGDVFLHLLPEVWENNSSKENTHEISQIVLGLWIIIGFLLFFMIEKIFIDQSQDKLDQKPIKKKNKRKNNACFGKTGGELSNGTLDASNQSSIKAEGYLNLLANFADNFTHGLAIGTSFMISFKVGMLTTVCILIHEIPHEVSDFVILLRAGFNRWKAAKLQLVTAGGSLIGSVFALTVDSTITAGLSKMIILPFTSGAFLYIATVSLLPSILAECSFRESLFQSLLISTGLFIMVIMSQFCG